VPPSSPPKPFPLNCAQELEYLNLALNNITRVENLERCESLRKLDLTLNFVPPAALPSLATLRPCAGLRELHLVGNPCTTWNGYRAYVAATLPQLARLDGEDIEDRERRAAVAMLPELQRQLQLLGEAEASAEGGASAEVSDDGGGAEAQSRPWCPATRLQDHHEQEQLAQAAEQAKRAAASSLLAGDGSSAPGASCRRPLRALLPPLAEGEDVRQCNEGGWAFTLEEEVAGGVDVLVLSVALPSHLDVTAVQADVQPRAVRLLAQGRLLQLRLSAEVRPGAAVARRSKATGRLVITMPVDKGEVAATAAKGRAQWGAAAAQRGGRPLPSHAPGIGMQQAQVCVTSASGEEGEDLPPPVPV
jgi:protein TilB